MGATDYVAIYGAVVSTVVAIWTIFRAVYQDRVRLRISMSNRALLLPTIDPQGADPLFITQVSVVNRSAFPVKVDSAGIHFSESVSMGSFNSPYLGFGPAPRLIELGYSLPLVIQPRDTGKSAAITAGVHQYLPVEEKPRVLSARGYVQLADGQMYYGKWLTMTVSKSDVRLETKKPFYSFLKDRRKSGSA